MGETNQNEIANIYGILKHILSGNANVAYLGASYASSRKHQDAIKGFNDRVLMVFLRHIEGYLTKIGIDMGMDESIKYAITVNKGQVNLASDNAVINATQNNGFYSDELKNIIDQIKNELSTMSAEDKSSVEESLEVLETEAKSDKPKRSMLKTALSTLMAVKGTTEFSSAVVTLSQFIQTLGWF